MASWILVPCLVQLRAEFNRIAPGRDRTTDGSVGDTAHQSSVSDHNPDETGSVPVKDADSVNEVHAIDVDVDLRTDGLTMEKVVQFLLSRCRSGAEKRLRYIIFNRRIWSASSGWVQQSYSGSNPHTAHAHFSASYDTAREASTASWHLEDLVALSSEDRAWIEALFARGEQPDSGGVTSKIGRDAFDQGVPNGVTGTKTPAWVAVRDIGTVVRETRALVLQLSQTGAEVDEIAIAASLLEGLDPAAIAASIPDDLAKPVAEELVARLASEESMRG
jgi:hypothetical protein